MSVMPMRVERVVPLTPHIRELVLATVDGSPAPVYTPGAHIELAVPLGAQAAHRAYSLVRPHDGGSRLTIAVQREDAGSGGSRWVHGLAEGDVVEVSAPRNAFALCDEAAEFLLIAGGIGVTPILCMARALHAAGRPYELHYAAREPALAAYGEEVAGLPGARCWFDGGDPARGLPLAEAIGAPRGGRHLYVCGPKGLIQAVFARARELGWPDERLHCELFAGALDDGSERAFTVELRASGVTLDVPADGTVLEAMEAAGLDPLFDCRRGECGICVAQVIEGEADHRDTCLSARERDAGSFCTCVSRARSARLALDL